MTQDASSALDPTVTQTSPQSWLPGEAVSFTLPAGTFTDPQGETLTYSASVGLGFASLPSWLTFNAATQTFSGVVPANEPARLSLNVIATNSSGQWNGERILVTTSTNPLIGADLSPIESTQTLSHQANTPITLTYSFMTAAPGSPFYASEGDGFQPLSAAQQAAVQQTLAAFAAVANVTFVQVADSASANIRFGTDSSTVYLGYTAFDPTGQTDQAHVMFNNSPQNPSPFGFLALHEIANCLHLADYSGVAQSAVSSYGLPAAYQNTSYLVGEDLPNTAAAYAPQEGYYPQTTPQLLDVQALQYLYGANQSGLTPGYVTTSYGRSYQFTDYATPQCIWVGSGVSGTTSFDFSACSGPAIINLNPGSFSSTVASAPANWVSDSAYLANQAGHATQNIAIAYGTTIQEAIGNNAGDVFYANSASDTLIGGTGNDIFHVSSGSCVIRGNGGTDTVVFSDPRADYSITGNGHGGLLVTEIAGPQSNGAATLYNVAQLQFSDQTITSPLPQLTKQTAAQTWATHQSILFTVAANTFTDPQGQPITLTASQADGSALPSWLSFDGSAFTGVVPGGANSLSLAVTATDTSGLAMTEYFAVTVNSSLVTVLPSAVTVAAGQANPLTGITVSDSNSQSGSETVTVTLSDLAGSLNATATAGGHVSGAGSNNLTLTGSLAEVNAELATVTYSGTATDSATTDTVSVSTSNGLGDSNTQQIAVTNGAHNYLTGNIPSQGASGTILNGPGTWKVVGTATLAGSGTSAALVPTSGAVLENDGALTLGGGTQAGFIGNNTGTQVAHGALINAAGATLTLNDGGIYVDSFENSSTLDLVLNQPTFTNYSGQQTTTLTIDSDITNTGTINISSNNNVGGIVLFAGGGSSSASAFGQGSATVASAYLVAVEFGGATPFTMTGGTYSLYSPVLVNSGATLNITGNTTFTHNLSDNGIINVVSGTLTSDYDIWGTPGTGAVNIDRGATLDIASSVLATANSGGDATINFNGPSATLILGTPSTFNGTLSGFAIGDAIDLANTQATGATLTNNSLVVSNGGTTVAAIPISGLAAGTQFTVTSDGAGGSLVELTPSASAAISAYQAGHLSSAVSVVDSAANVSAALASLEPLALAGKLSSITLTDSGTPTLAVTAVQAAQDAAALHTLTGSYALSVTGTTATLGSFLAKEDISGRGLNGIAADYAGTAPAGGNAVDGFQNASFTGGYDAVVLDGPRSSYAIQVAANGATTIKDIGAGDASYGQTITVSGESYLVFNGGASTTVSGLPVYGSIYFVDSPANAQLAQFYAAATQFKSSIALSGLEYWENQLAAGMSLTAIAQSFLNTSYFQTTYGDPGTTHAQHLAFVETLYQNILGMTLDANNAGVQYWTSDMDNGMSGAVELISFTNATANTSVLNAVSGTTAGSGSGWLIDPTATGGYADPGLQIAAQTVLSQAAAANFYNLSLVDPTTVGSAGVSANGVTLTPGTVTLGAGAPGSTVYLSASFTHLVANNGGDSIHDGPGADSITVTGTGNVLTLGNATSDSLNLANATGSYVFGFTPGHGSLLAVSGTANPTAATLLSGTTTAVQGASLTFGASPIFVTIGSVGGNSAAEVAVAANKAYAVAGSAAEHVVFLGTDNGGNAEIWTFKAASGPADVNGNHLVDANEITLVATLIGVSASSLTAADLA